MIFKANGNKYDILIRGWTQFWNDILSPDDRLDANLVKALIASESGFQLNPKNPTAFGLMQITEVARKSLAGAKNELKEHLVHVDKEDILDPNFNIAAGVRWLFQKRSLASHRLNRQATWDEAVAEYKSYLKDMIQKPKITPKGMGIFRDFYRRLQK